MGASSLCITSGSEKNFHKRETARPVAGYVRLPLHATTSAFLLRWWDPGLCLDPPSCGRLGLSPSNPRFVTRSATEGAPELFRAFDEGQRPPPSDLPGFQVPIRPCHRCAVTLGNPPFRFIRGMTNAIVFNEPHLKCTSDLGTMRGGRKDRIYKQVYFY